MAQHESTWPRDGPVVASSLPLGAQSQGPPRRLTKRGLLATTAMGESISDEPQRPRTERPRGREVAS